MRNELGKTPPPDAGSEVGLFARIEGLVGQETALLRIPAEERTGEQHDRLRSIAGELDRVWEKLRERAERLGDGQPPSEQPT
jgi:hypothetical protein